MIKILILISAVFIRFSGFIDCKLSSIENQKISEIISEKSFGDGEFIWIHQAIQYEKILFVSTSQTDIEFDCCLEEDSPQWFYTLSFLKRNKSKGFFLVKKNNSLLLDPGPPPYPGGIDYLGHVFSDKIISLKEIKSGTVNKRAGQFSEVSICLRWLCIGLFWLLRAIFYVIPNWGVAIIILALVVRLLLYPLTRRALKGQHDYVEAQKLLLPELRKIRIKYKGGEQSERILELYKKHKVSPFSGLKPLLIVLIQLPILIALYRVLGSVDELHDARFLWIDSLALPDHLFNMGFNIPILGNYLNLLPLIMTVFTLLSFKLYPTPATDKKNAAAQKIYMIILALSFFFLFYSFPAGMVLYWTFANIFQLIQQRMIIHYSKVDSTLSI